MAIDVATLRARLIADTGQFDASMSSAGKSARKFGAAMAGAVTAAIGIGTAGKAIVDFDKEMRNVNSLAQLGEKDFRALEKQVLKLAGPTVQAPATLAAGLYDLVSSGFKANDAIKVLKASAYAATAGLTTTEVSAKAVAGALNAYGLKAKDAGKVSDILFRTVDQGVISFEELAHGIGPVLPVARKLGVSLEQVGAMTATLTKAGIPAAEAFTYQKGAMVALIKPTDAMAAAFKKLGVESGGELIKKTGSLQGALKALSGTVDGNATAMAGLFPEIRGMTAAMGVTSAKSKDAAKDLQALRNSGGATATAFKEQSKSISHQWKALKSTAEAAIVGVSVALLGWVDTNKESFKQIGATIKDGLAEIKVWLKDHQDTIDDVKTAVSDFGDIATDVWEAIKPVVVDALKGAWQALKGFGTALAGMLKTITSLLHGDFREAWEGVKQIFSGALTNIAGILRAFTAPFRAAAKTVGNAIIDGIESLAGAFVAVGKWVVNRIADGVTTLTDALGAVGGWIKNRVVESIQATAAGFVAAGTWIVNRVADGVTTITGALASVGGWIKNRVVEGIHAMGGALGAAGEWVIDKIADGARAFGAAFYNIGKNILNSMVSGIKAGASSVVGAIKGVVSGAINEAKGLLGIRSPSKVFAQFGRQTVAGFAQGLAADPRAVMRGLQTGMFDPLAAGISSSSAGGGGITSGPRIASGSGGGVGGNTYNLVVQALDPQQAATAVIRAIDQFETRNGRRFARA